MSYTYLRDAGEESSAESYSAIEQSAPWRSNHTAAACYCNGSATESCHASQSGMTCEPSTERRGEESLTSWPADSRAKTSALPEKATDSTENEADSGKKWFGSLATFDPATSSWKTPQLSLLAGLDEFSETWPRWGMMRNGACSARTAPERLTAAKDSGCSLPTLTLVSCEHPGRYKIKDGQQTCISAVLAARDKWKPRGQYSPSHAAWLMGWPDSWTSFVPMGTDKFQSWLQAHGEYLRRN